MRPYRACRRGATRRERYVRPGPIGASGRSVPERAFCADGSARERACFVVDRPGLRGAGDRDHRTRRRGYTLIDDASCERPYNDDIRSDVCFERRGPCELHLERPRAGARRIRLAARTNHQEWLVHLAVRPVDISRCSTIHIADVERLLVSRRRPHVLAVCRQRADEEGDYQRRDIRAGADGRERLHRPVFRAPGLDPVLTCPNCRSRATSRRAGPTRMCAHIVREAAAMRRERYVRSRRTGTSGSSVPERAICAGEERGATCGCVRRCRDARCVFLRWLVQTAASACLASTTASSTGLTATSSSPSTTSAPKPATISDAIARFQRVWHPRPQCRELYRGERS